MAITTVEKPLRINLSESLWLHAGFCSEKITAECYIVCYNDCGTEFDVFTKDPGTSIDWKVNADYKRRISLSPFTKGVKPGDEFRITAKKGCIHVKKVDTLPKKDVHKRTQDNNPASFLYFKNYQLGLGTPFVHLLKQSFE